MPLGDLPLDDNTTPSSPLVPADVPQASLKRSPKQAWLAFLKSSFLGKQVKLFQVELLEKLKLPQTGP
jgi:hypothetical protein